MVARTVSYYGKGFKGGRGVTQGDPLSPTIFNVVVDADCTPLVNDHGDGGREKEGTGKGG